MSSTRTETRTAAPLSYTRSGSGEPLVLLHGLGSSRRSWDPVVPLLTKRFDVIAIDLPGFGDSPPLAGGAEPHPAAIAAAVDAALRDLAVETPHVAGNSLGGWVALELAPLRPVGSITLFSPAGLWRDRTPLYNRISLTTLRALARFGGPAARPLARFRAARWVMFRQIVGRPSAMTTQQARQAIADMGDAPGFRATMRASLPRAYTAHGPIDAPISLSFGTRDCLLLPHQSRRVERLPARARLVPLRGTGHVPMTDDPAAVASLIGRTVDSKREVQVVDVA